MIDLTKPVQTRDGRKVRILATDLKSNHGSIVGVTTTDKSDDRVVQWYSDGSYVRGEENGIDLVNTPEETFVYINVYADASTGRVYSGALYDNQNDADMWACKTRVGRMKIKLERRFDD